MGGKSQPLFPGSLLSQNLAKMMCENCQTPTAHEASDFWIWESGQSLVTHNLF